MSTAKVYSLKNMHGKKTGEANIYPLFIDFNYLELHGQVITTEKSTEFIKQHGPEVVIVPTITDGVITSWHLIPMFRLHSYLKSLEV